MQVSQFCNGAEMTYIFPIALKETLRFFLKSASEKYLKISPKIIQQKHEHLASFG